MKKFWGMLVTGLMVCSAASAAGAKFLTLEDAALSQAKKWQQTGVAKPIMSDDGKILFPFGQYLPTITCSPLRACDIELEPGEILTAKPLAGDTVRWKLALIESGIGDKKINHIVIKPTDTNLDTNLIIATDKRTYHIRMYSSAKEGDYVNRVGFYYPQEITEEWDQSARLARREAKEKEKLVVSDIPNMSVDKLDFGYTIEGEDNTIKPVRVFNEGTRVFIQMPESMRTAEAPILLLYDKGGKPQVVNYRVKDLYYIVDKLFDKAMLVAGTDKTESKVVITWDKTQKKRWFW